MGRAAESGIAIVGMGAIFPGARTALAFWNNILAGHCAIRDASGLAYDAAFLEADPRVPHRGAFIDNALPFDPAAFRMPPDAASSAEPEQVLCLHLARAAIHDAGYSRSRLRGARAGVVIGRGNTPGPRRIQAGDRVRGLELLRTQLFAAGAHDEESKRRFEEAFLREAVGPAALGIDLVPNLVASRINQALDLRGLAHTVDAACASALVALDRCCLELRARRADAMLCGAVHLSRDEVFWKTFSTLGALSASGTIRPYDARADGLVIGEGAGMLMLKREDDAIRDHDRIYAVIRGCGIASDGSATGLAAPSTEGQLRAIADAWEEAGEDPARLGVLEGHGTGTALGDATELETIRRFFGQVRGGTLGSVKSMIGHAMPAAGMAGLIKTVWALHHAIRPPSLHCEVPHAELDGAPFTVSAAPSEWAEPRRLAAVNAFGFGGINAHVVLASAEQSARPTQVARPRLALFAGENAAALAARIAGGTQGGSGFARARLSDPNTERVSLATRLLERGIDRSRRLGVSLCTKPLLGRHGKLAFVFPGFSSRFEPRLDGLNVEAGADLDESDVRTGFEILRVNAIVARNLVRLGVEPDAVVGHSLGEWSAMMFSGMVSPKAVHGFAPSLALDWTAHELGYLTASCSAQELVALGSDDGLELSHDNCPKQSAVSGPLERLERLRATLLARGVVATIHPFGSGIHTRYFSGRAAAHRENIGALSYRSALLPAYSSVSAAPYPEDSTSIEALAAANLTQPVRFREVIERMYADGYRVFVQAGAGGLTPFIESTLGDRPHLALSANVPTCSGLQQLLCTACDVWTAGGTPLFDVMADLTDLESPVSFDLGLQSPLPRRIWSGPMSSPAVSANAPDDLLARFHVNLELLARAQHEVQSLASQVRAERRAVGPSSTSIRRSVRLSLEDMPELADHCLYRQAADCSDWTLRQPVVPLAALILEMAERAQAEWSGSVAVGLSEVVAQRWLEVSSAVELEVGLRRTQDRVDVALSPYARGVVTLAAAHPQASKVAEPVSVNGDGAHWTLPMRAEDLYSGGWMFHGPAYQGVRRFVRVGERFVEAELEVTRGKGALIDAAAQVLGALVMARTSQDRLAMPIGVSQVRFFGAYPALGHTARCCVRLDSLTDEVADGTLTIWVGERLWAQLSGWRLRRMPSDERLFGVMQGPGSNALSTYPEPGIARFIDRYPSALEQEFIARRYLAARELQEWTDIAPARRRPWLAQRVASKDAALWHLRAATRAEVFPGELRVERQAAGDAVIRERDGATVHVACSRAEQAVLARIAGAIGERA